MLGMEEIFRELGDGGGCTVVHEDNHHRHRHGLPPGFRFHPTDEELLTFYLASKVLNNARVNNIAEVDLNRCEPWELPESAKMGEREWYFFSLRDRKYPTGLRTNRATCAGYWKATGKDREVYGNGNSSSSDDKKQMIVVGMKKTLVFYKGRAPRGEKTKWVMHEYRLDVDFFHRHSCKEEWVICRILHKIGEKKPNMLIHDQTLHHLNLIRACSVSPSSAAAATTGGGFLLPPLLEPPPPAALMESQSHNHNHHQELEDGRLIISMESHQKNPFNNNNNNLIINNQKQEECYVQQIKSVINPVFSNNAPAGNVWGEFMGIPFVNGDIIVGDHELLLMAADRNVSSSSSSLISLF